MQQTPIFAFADGHGRRRRVSAQCGSLVREQAHAWASKRSVFVNNLARRRTNECTSEVASGFSLLFASGTLSFAKFIHAEIVAELPRARQPRDPRCQ
jgi:hypothetical protein